MIFQFPYVEPIHHEKVIQQIKREAHTILATVGTLNVSTPTTVSLQVGVRK